MQRKRNTPAADAVLPVIRAELSDPIVKGPMSADAVEWLDLTARRSFLDATAKERGREVDAYELRYRCPGLRSGPPHCFLFIPQLQTIGGQQRNESLCRPCRTHSLAESRRRRSARDSGSDAHGVASNIGDILYSPEITAKLGADFTLHLLALYCDPRGSNLRNQVAHGLLYADRIQLSAASRVLHTLLTLRIWDELASAHEPKKAQTAD